MNANVLINIDVDDLERARAFYCGVFGLMVTRKFGDGALELGGAAVPIYLLLKAAGTLASSKAAATRSYSRHWTPVHLDFVVSDVDAAVARAVAADAVLEDPPVNHVWGRIAHLSDPFGNGICILQFLNRGYDELSTQAVAIEPSSDPAGTACTSLESVTN